MRQTIRLLLSQFYYNNECARLSGKLFFSCVFLSVLVCSSLIPSAKAASMWNSTYGGVGEDVAFSLVEVSDGGYAIAGVTTSFGVGAGDIAGGDFWLVKTDVFGSIEWNRTYGELGFDVACSVISTLDGGFALAGSKGLWNDTGDGDFWLVKTDALGNMEWNRTYAGKEGDMTVLLAGSDDIACSVIATSDGGYALAGTTNADFKSFYPMNTDFWLVKTDALGNMEWNKTYGGNVSDEAYSLVATSDGGYAIAGVTASFGAGYRDFWLVKTDANGNMLWNRTYGGSDWDWAWSLVATSDGGYALAGYSNISDFWLVKTDAFGNMLWNRTYDRSWDGAYSLVATLDGGYAVAGNTVSPAGNYFWLIKTDALGNEEWNQTYEGSSLGDGWWDWACSLVATLDGGYAIASYVASDVSVDIRFVKTDEFGVVPEYSSWLVPALVLTATAFIILNKKRLRRKSS